MSIMKIKQPDGQIVTIPFGMSINSDTGVNTHNTDKTAHADIREQINQLSSDFERSAAYIKQYPNENGEYVLEMGKTYLVERAAENDELGYWKTELVEASVSGGVHTGEILYNSVSDPYNPFYKVRLCDVKWEYNPASSGFSGNVYYQVDGYYTDKGVRVGEFSDGGDYIFDDMIARIFVTGASNVLLVNEHAEIVAKDAYEIAVDEGFEGTRSEWLDTLGFDFEVVKNYIDDYISSALGGDY